MMLLFNHDKAVADWVGSKVGKPFSEPFTAIGVLDGQGTLIGGAVFNGYIQDTAVEISIAGKGVVSRAFWKACRHYVFEQLNCIRLSIHTSNKKGNKRVRKMANDFGFVFEGVERCKYGPHHDAARYAITASDMPKLKEKWRL